MSAISFGPIYDEITFCSDTKRPRVDVDIDRRRIDQLLLGCGVVALAAFAVIS